MYDLPFIPDEKDVKPSGKFYYEGRYFDDEEAFWKYVKNFNSLKVSRQTFDRMIDRIKEDLWANYCMQNKMKSNGEMKEILGEMLLAFVERIGK